jgi:hypothetical protein
MTVFKHHLRMTAMPLPRWPQILPYWGIRHPAAPRRAAAARTPDGTVAADDPQEIA